MFYSEISIRDRKDINLKRQLNFLFLTLTIFETTAIPHGGI
jgi:hypothetical protein